MQLTDTMPLKCDGYFATRSGQIISVKRGKSRVLKPGQTSPYGHQSVTMSVNGKQTAGLVHRLVFEAYYGPIADGLEVDHIDRNPRNNALSNLRLATRMQNARNNSGHRKSKSVHAGVTWHSRIGKWQATIRVNKKLVHLGYYSSEDMAAKVRKSAAAEYFGEFAPRDNNGRH